MIDKMKDFLGAIKFVALVIIALILSTALVTIAGAIAIKIVIGAISIVWSYSVESLIIILLVWWMMVKV